MDIPNQPRWQSLIEILRWRARYQPDQQVYTFLSDGEADETSFTFAGLERRALAIAARLQSTVPSGARALLLYPPGLDYIAAFFGCLCAKVVPVPLYPPRLSQTNRGVERLRAVMRDSEPGIALVSHSVFAAASKLIADRIAVLVTDDVEDSFHKVWQSPKVASSDLAFLQYTSGSTSGPKGVMLTHANLLHNCSLMQRCFALDPETRLVIWLPPYHDMGLIGGIIAPLYVGFPVTLMLPTHFLQRPVRWLQAISRYRATTSGAPNFAYDLCARQVSEQLRATLDLTSWRVAFNGAEPIRADTLERFVEAFASVGFRRQSFCPCYGLAEATLIVSGNPADLPPVVPNFRAPLSDRNKHEKDDNASYVPDDDGNAVVGCGRSLSDQLRIVDPETIEPCEDGQVGEVWVQGPSVAQGYWKKPEESQRDFRASLIHGERPFLRTGDLGFMYAGELFVTGRIKDLIILQGRNHYPQDIELTVERATSMFRPGCGAAFSIVVNGEERLVVAQEVKREHRHRLDVDHLTELVRRAVVQNHEAHPHAVALLRPGAVPKTSSGKVQRYACRQAFLDGNLKLLGCRTFPKTDSLPDLLDLSVDEVTPESAAGRALKLERYMRALVARRLHVDISRIDPTQPLVTQGLDSLAAAELQQRLEATTRLNLPLASLLGDVTIKELVAQLLGSPELDTTVALVHPMDREPTTGPQPLSYGQRALWFLQKLAPAGTAYNIMSALRPSTPLDISSLNRAISRLVARHPILASTFVTLYGEPLQEHRSDLSIELQVEKIAHESNEAFDRYLHEMGNQAFDLEKGPLFRIHVFTRPNGEQILLFVVHHIIVDFWSLVIVARDLDELYRSERDKVPAVLPSLEADYLDHVSHEAELVGSPHGDRLWSYWRERLDGEVGILNLPTDRPRPPTQTYVGATEELRLGAELTQAVEGFSRAEGVTLFMFLLAVYQLLLGRYSGSTDLVVGSPVAGRDRQEFANVVGYFVNPIVLRADLAKDPPFREFLAQVRGTVLGAFSHQAFPFAALAQRLQPVRDLSRSPVFQAMFMFQQAPSFGKDDLSLFGIGAAGATMTLGEVPLESLAVEQRTAQFDLTLAVAPANGRLYISLRYNRDLFDVVTIRRMLGYYRTILEAAVSSPDCPIGALPIIPEAERRELLAGRDVSNIGESESIPNDCCIHHLVEAQAASTPEATALVFEEVEITYRDLNYQANQVAHELRLLGVGPEVRAAICVDRSPDLIVGLLGILKAGGAYVPLDPAYPRHRLKLMLEDSRARVLVTNSRQTTGFSARGEDLPAHTLLLDTHRQEIRKHSGANPQSGVAAANLAYVIYTSGSTGVPKGVMIQHRSVINFFAGMDKVIKCDANDTLLAVTSVSFDISVLELLWTLACGARIVLTQEPTGAESAANRKRQQRPMDFSMFYFANASSEPPREKYQLVLEGAKFADEHGLTAVWTPERHFHEFGGLYPNPAVLGAMLAGVTQRIQIRAGSVVLPLHDPIRVAEEWSLLDNLSNGRVGVAFASGWHADDFVFFPDNYTDRRQVMVRGIETIKTLWRGDSISARSGSGGSIDVNIFPRPVQKQLPMWITATGSIETFKLAGRLGCGVLTHLVTNSMEELVRKIQAYRESLETAGHHSNVGRVVLMLHTFIGEDRDAVREIVREPLIEYLRTSVDLIGNLIKSLDMPLDLQTMNEEDVDALLEFAFDRYFQVGGLLGTAESCTPFVETLSSIGVDEIACLIDFGVPAQLVLESLPNLARLKENVCESTSQGVDYSLAAQATRHQPSLLQCTPSLMRMLAETPSNFEALSSLRTLMLGGEALPPALALQVQEKLQARTVNMYGPTETTIWSSTQEVGTVANTVPIGQPILNTQLYVLDSYLEPQPVGVVGELYIGGAGLARGYVAQPGVTAERFLPDPWSREAGGRMYRTGDLVRYRNDGTLEFLGRKDYQIKLRGFRIELPEIEAVLARHEGVREAVAVVREDNRDDGRLVAYVIPRNGPDVHSLRAHLNEQLPAYMVPSYLVALDAFPLTANGKVDRKNLPVPDDLRLGTGLGLPSASPRNKLEQTIAAIWRKLLGIKDMGIHDNFFDLGGHSLLMARAQSQLRDQLHQEVPLLKLLEHPTISSLAGYLDERDSASPSFQASQQRAQRQLGSRRRGSPKLRSIN